MRKLIDLTGQRFGRLKVQDVIRKNVNGKTRTLWRCICICGNEIFSESNALLTGKTVSCGCYKNEMTARRNFIDLTGNKYGKLTVIERNGYTPNGKTIKWKCQCDCGKIVDVAMNGLKSGTTQSCGCIRNAKIEWIEKPCQYPELGNCHICINRDCTEDGYPRMKVKGKGTRIHRYLYEQVHGKISEGLVVCHHCDTPNCINVNHLFLGTNADNLHDMFLKGRSSFGERNGRAKLIEQQVIEIRSDKLSSDSELSKKYGVDKTVIHNIKIRKLWKHIA